MDVGWEGELGGASMARWKKFIARARTPPQTWAASAGTDEFTEAVIAALK